ncbi:TPA: hypothetical protein ACU967_002262 [Burkholderia contaminans]|uniref:hypothetical protein n=1 Tax=Burkholderia contaminans TaxID=488447 RepID=UPI000D0043EB|nr:hypothetical protein [Burkholderia contaminans]HDR9065505.1 hypothetical protein [Burkholderia vietnamiensis]MBM6427944.1 hypothetical protein [Burkholderia contaminans]MCA7876775.1 DUF2591 domain-containing protein [Burkholderia contaminans]MDN8024202.1 hypothetical protein [Burkholderia contaminans]PRG12202.1 hypothetical protein C6Q17_14185 [Burkholderia contaminans]
MRQIEVAALVGAALDYWVARAIDMPRPVIVVERVGAAECLVEVDGTVFEPFTPSADEDLCNSIIGASPVLLMRVGTPIGPAWCALAPTGARFVSVSWRIAALRALVALRFGAFVVDDVEADAECS